MHHNSFHNIGPVSTGIVQQGVGNAARDIYNASGSARVIGALG